MKVMVIVKATQSSEAGELPSEELLREMGQYNEELVKAGIMLSGEGLHPSSKGVRIRFSGDLRIRTDGPFSQTEELIAGFWLWRVKSMEEAVEWVKRCPNPMKEVSDIEIRQVFEAEDFGDNFTPELREKEAVMRAQTLGLGTPRYENGKEMTIAGLKESYTGETRGNISEQWKRFLPQVQKIAGSMHPPMFGVCWSSGSHSGIDYLTGVEVHPGETLPADLASVRLEPSRYVVFEHAGHVSSLGQTLDDIWMKWAPDCGLNIAEAPWFERYPENFDPKTSTSGIEIRIPIA